MTDPVDSEITQRLLTRLGAIGDFTNHPSQDCRLYPTIGVALVLGEGRVAHRVDYLRATISTGLVTAQAKCGKRGRPLKAAVGLCRKCYPDD